MRKIVSNCIRVLPALGALLFALAAVACQPQSPEQRVANLRADYQARLNTWFIKREPPPPAAIGEEGEEAESTAEESPEGADESEAADPAASEAATGEEGEESEIEVEDLGPELRDVVLDIELWHDSQEMLPGITLDVTQADAAENEKATYRIWADTSNLRRGSHTQINHVLEDIEVADDDRFSVEVRQPVPADERGEYDEFDTAG